MARDLFLFKQFLTAYPEGESGKKDGMDQKNQRPRKQEFPKEMQQKDN